MFNFVEFVKERFLILEGEMFLGVSDAKFHLQALAYQYGTAYGKPEAITFYNALNFPDGDPDFGWIDKLPDGAGLRNITCDMPCNECAHRMLVAACYLKNTNEKTAAYLTTACETLEDPALKDRIRSVVDKLVESEEFLMPLAEEVLYAVDAELSTIVSESEGMP